MELKQASWPVHVCICTRGPAEIVCTNTQCSFSSHGRVRRQCPSHPKVTFLLDLVHCPWCGTDCVEQQPDVQLSPAPPVCEPVAKSAEDRGRFRPQLTRNTKPATREFRNAYKRVRH
ncbi:uncharacterized protein LOC106670794 [Cimex lectularius]|uniref:Uncharacterized protein n=1 Tax=Cimex lectularius TaxID=79782 RepID=A0A8I6TGS9_CIMLE|nr:uncharacterized protein LOC106670794 [Cimex lectularius]XP_014256874.1 uncharacterized protein LOC106670794 [Cimex lectularius]XP_014256875.1 uncharacterized protein LOC106670794 [Cimex lectularius]